MDPRFLIPVVPFAASVDLGSPLQAIGYAVGLAAVLVVGRAKRKDALIADLEKTVAQRDRERDDLDRHLAGVQARADQEHERRREAERGVSAWVAKYEMLERFAAPEAFDAIAEKLTLVDATTSAALAAQGELILKNTELVSAAVCALERVAVDLEALTGRIEALPH